MQPSQKTHINIVALGARCWFHTMAIATIAVLQALLVVDLQTFRLFYDAIYRGNFGLDWAALGVHLGISALIWGLIVLGYYLWRRRNQRAVKLYRARGSVTVETLIVMVPFLLLTSGLAQYSLINVASILSDLAVYQAARTAWIWQPEAKINRRGTTADDVRVRALTAAALTLAPSASSSFLVGRNQAQGSNDDFRRIRTGIAATFYEAPFGVTGEEFWNITGQNWHFFSEANIDASHDNLNFTRALDDHSFYLRAGRKVTSAWMNLEDDFDVITQDGKVGVRFTYQFALTFPWFAYIFGQNSQIAMRDAHHIPIPRTMMLDKHPDF